VPSGIVGASAGFFLAPLVVFPLAVFPLVAFAAGFGSSVLGVASALPVVPVAANWPGSVFLKRLSGPLVVSSLKYCSVKGR
jgi:hypothetical protein